MMREKVIKSGEDFQQEIRQLMEKYNLSPEAIGAKLHITAQTVYRWERGISKPRSKIVLQALEEFKKELRGKA